MAGTNVSTKAKLKAVTSPTKASRQTLTAAPNTPDGVKLPTGEKAEAVREQLARLIDVTHNWPYKLGDTMPLPHVVGQFIFFAFPTGGHVIRNSVTSDGGQNFLVDDVTVIPVTSEAK